MPPVRPIVRAATTGNEEDAAAGTDRTGAGRPGIRCVRAQARPRIDDGAWVVTGRVRGRSARAARQPPEGGGEEGASEASGGVYMEMRSQNMDERLVACVREVDQGQVRLPMLGDLLTVAELLH